MNDNKQSIPVKNLDAVQVKYDAQSRIYERTKHLSFRERAKLLKKHNKLTTKVV